MIVKGKITKLRMAAMDYFADILLTKQMSRHIIVTVTFRKKMDHLGLTEVDDYNHSGKPREFLIDVDLNQTEKEIIRTLAHEMVHVKQYAYGELNEEGTNWCGTYLPRDLAYHEQPWEIEAHDISDLLLEQFMENYNVKWS